MGMIAATVTVADIVIVPVQPSGLDLWAANSVVDLIKQRQEIAEGKPKAAFIISRQISHTKLAAESRAALQELGFPIFQSYTSQRIAYASAASNGKTVLDMEPEGIATQEVLAIAHELKEFSSARR
jgi:chromosome partitioning protein